MRNLNDDCNINLFISNPNLKYNSTIITENGPFYGYNDIFEIYTHQKINETFVASQNNKNKSINIFYLTNKKLLKKLISHESDIISIKYFINISKKNEFLLSSDKNNKVIIWDIDNNYIIKHCLFKGYNNNYIYSCLLLFNLNTNNKNILVTTCGGIAYKRDHNSFTKIYSLKNMQNIKKIRKTNDNNTLYAIPWINKENGNVYIVEFCYHKISINNIIKNEIGFELSTKKTRNYFYYFGFIYINNIVNNNNDLLVAISTNGYIEIWNLNYKYLVNNIYLKGCNLKNGLQWNMKYMIVVDCGNKCFFIIDIIQLKVISKICGIYTNSITCIKKIKNNKFGECLLSGGYNNCINLWTNNCI